MNNDPLTALLTWPMDLRSRVASDLAGRVVWSAWQGIQWIVCPVGTAKPIAEDLLLAAVAELGYKEAEGYRLSAQDAEELARQFEVEVGLVHSVND